jgi:hypothetical protein
MISFRCWFCNKGYAVAERRIGARLRCSCERYLRVPKVDGGDSRSRTFTDWLVETTVYGGAGAFLGCGFALLLVSQLRWLPRLESTWVLVPTLTLLGFLVRLFGGERAVNWIGRLIRQREDRRRR